MKSRYTASPGHSKAFLRIADTSWAFPNMLIASIQDSNFSCMTNFTAFIKFSLHWVWTRWSAQNWDEYQMRGEMVNLSVAEISAFFMLEDFKSHMLKCSSDDTMVFKHSTASWRSWRLRSWMPKNLGRSSRNDGERRKSSNERWWKRKMEPESMTDIRPFLMNFSICRLSSPGSLISTVSSSGCLAKIVAPTTEVIALISPLRAPPNDVLMTVKYKECKLFSPLVSSSRLRLSKRASGFTKRKSAAVVARINIPAARGTR